MQSEPTYGHAPDLSDVDGLIEAGPEPRVADMVREPLRLLAVAGLYGIACLMLGAESWKAALVALIILMSLMLDLGRRMIMRVGLVFIPYAICVWLGLLPDPASLRQAVCRL